jgi:hypothetical protein
MEKVKESLKSYAQLNIVQEIRDDMQTKADREEITIIASQNQEIVKNSNKYATVAELVSRLEIIQDDLNKKIKIRPTIIEFN